MTELAEQASIYLIILPLLAAPITALLPNGRLPWLMTMLTSGICLFLAILLLRTVMTGTVIDYELGGWAPPWGIAYRIDAISALMVLLISVIGTAVTIYAWDSVQRDIPQGKQSLFYALFQLCFLGLLGMSMTGDLFNVFVFLEIASLSAYILIAMGQNRQALLAAFSYLIGGTVGASFFLLGIGLAYAATGTLNMADLAQRLPQSEHQQTIVSALGLIFLGMALKAAMFPLHQWLVRAYSYAPIVVSAFLAGTATKVAVYVIGRSAYSVFSISYVATTFYDELLLLLGSMAVIYGAVKAISQEHIKPLLAWSSISQIGYFMLGLGLLSSTGLMAVMIHLFNHALIKSVLFLAAGILLYQTGTLRISGLAGVGRQSRWVFAVWVIAGLSLIGVPGTVGFVSKWYLVWAAVELRSWWLVGVVLLGSGLSIIYMWKIIEVMYFPSNQRIEIRPVAQFSLLVPSVVLAGACVYLGLDTQVTVGAAQMAIQSLGLKP